jgi:hypothetical protein
MVRGHAAIAPGQGRFMIVAAALIGGATGIGIWKA